MNSKNRLNTALNHKNPDRIPVDFGSTAVTGIHVSSVSSLRDYYGLEKRPVKAYEPYQMLGLIEDDLMEAMGIDTRSVPPWKTMFGFVNENWKEFQMPWGQVVLVSEHFTTSVDENGDLLIYPEADLTAPPSGRMPVDGYFIDTIIRQEPIIEDELNPENNLEEFGLIVDEELKYFENEVNKLKNSGKGIVATFGGTAIGDIALVPAPFLKYPKGIRDVTEWYISTVTRQDYLHVIFTRQSDIALENLKKIHTVVGDDIDVVFICGTDLGTQNSSFCSVETYNDLYAPYYKKINDWIHKNTRWKTLKHSCGSVKKFIPGFINSGFDILNPVQCSALNMDPQQLKNEFGNQIIFWGGGVDTQKTLPFGTTEQVRTEVLNRCEVFSKNGGFVFNTIHNIQANVPVENIVTLINAVNEFNT